LYISGTTPSTSTATGALTVVGGVGITGALNVGGSVGISGQLNVGGSVGISGQLNVGGSVDISGQLSINNFGGNTNVMAKATNAAGGVGQVIPLMTWGAGIGGGLNRNYTTPIPAGTWLICLHGNGDGAGNSENPFFSMAQTWVVPTGKWLVFAHSDYYTTTASASTSGLAWKLVTDPAPFRTATNDFDYAVITSGNGWNNISKSNGTAQLMNEQNADTATGGDKPASGCVYKGEGWYVICNVQGYAMRIA
jgi:hypothetical protein